MVQARRGCQVSSHMSSWQAASRGRMALTAPRHVMGSKRWGGRVTTSMPAGGRALVLGGGGVTGVAWETGLLFGLAEAGVDLATADVLVGTSAGSVVAAQVACGVALDELYAAQ